MSVEFNAQQFMALQEWVQLTAGFAVQAQKPFANLDHEMSKMFAAREKLINLTVPDKADRLFLGVEP